jgi:hypothetical protein
LTFEALRQGVKIAFKKEYQANILPTIGKLNAYFFIQCEKVEYGNISLKA